MFQQYFLNHYFNDGGGASCYSKMSHWVLSGLNLGEWEDIILILIQ